MLRLLLAITTAAGTSKAPTPKLVFNQKVRQVARRNLTNNAALQNQNKVLKKTLFNCTSLELNESVLILFLTTAF